jgi:hypothetical protein
MNLTIFFTFYCDSDIRRKYLELCVKTLFAGGENNNIEILVVDGSPAKDYVLNKKIFTGLSKVRYFHDTESNPFKRCAKYFHKIETDYVLRLLEDIVFVHNKNFLNYVQNDMNLLMNNEKIDVVHYLMVDDSKYEKSGDVIYFQPLDFTGKHIISSDNWKYYDHGENGFKYHYLCNNVLYRTNLLINQWNYLAKNYSSHNAAEAGNMNIYIYNCLKDIRYLRGVVRLFIRFYEKLLHSNEIIKSIVITETLMSCDVLHIGYSRVENKTLLRKKHSISKNLINLRFFNHIPFLNNVKFKRKKSLFGEKNL